jgi:hypothetical protein
LRGVAYSAVIDSSFTDFHCTSRHGACTDAKAIGGGNGNSPMGPYKIVNNFLEASGEVILFGGAGATQTAADIEIRRNHFFKPLLWMPGAVGFIGGPLGDPFIVKNHFELKNAQRVLLEGNIFENNWGGFSQTGKSIVLNVRNNFSKAKQLSNCPVCQVTDITFRYNTISHVGGGIGIADILTAGKPALAGARFSIHDMVMDDIDATRFNGGGSLFLIANAWSSNVLNSIMINHVTGFPDPGGHLLTLGNSSTNPKMWGFVFTNNIAFVPTYSVWSAGYASDCSISDRPLPAIPNCFQTYAFSNNVLFASHFVYPPAQWPAGNYFELNSVGFVNYNGGIGGDYHLLSSSPYKNKASDGRDPGADIDAVQAAIAGVY